MRLSALVLLSIFASPLGSPAGAVAGGDGCTGALYTSLEGQRRNAIDDVPGTTRDAYWPLIEFAGRHQGLLSRDERGEIDPYRVQLAFYAELKTLLRRGCIDAVTHAYYFALAGRFRVDAADGQAVIPLEVEKSWPSIRNYWFNRAYFDEVLRAKYPDPKTQSRIAGLDARLERLFDRKVPGIGKVSGRNYILLVFLRTDILKLGSYAEDFVKASVHPRGKVTLYGSTLEPDRDYEIAPGDIDNFALNRFEGELLDFQAANRKVYPIPSLEFDDAILAYFLSGDLDYDSLERLLEREDYRTPKRRFWKNAANEAWTISRPILYQIPLTVPFVTLADLILESKKRKNEYDDAQARKKQLIRR